MPSWVKTLLNEWLQATNLTAGKLFRRVNKNGRAWGDGLTEKAVWHVVREYGGNRQQRIDRHGERPAVDRDGWLDVDQWWKRDNQRHWRHGFSLENLASAATRDHCQRSAAIWSFASIRKIRSAGRIPWRATCERRGSSRIWQRGSKRNFIR